MHPFDTISTRMKACRSRPGCSMRLCMTRSRLHCVDAVGSDAYGAGPDYRRHGQDRCTSATNVTCCAPHRADAVAAEGFRSYYRGVGATLLASAPTSALYFFTYERIKHAVRAWRMLCAQSSRRVHADVRRARAWCHRCTTPLSTWLQVRARQRLAGLLGLTARGAAAGGASEFFSSLVYVPLEVVKCRLQLGPHAHTWTGGLVPRQHHYRHTLHALTVIARAEVRRHGWPRSRAALA